MEKLRKIVLPLLLAAIVLSGCSQPGSGSTSQKETLQIVTTIFPVYDWVQELLGDADAQVTMLLDKSTDLHSFQPTAEDMLQIANCDLFVYVGGESDDWVEEALKNTAGKNRTVLNLMEILGSSVREEEWVEGMQEADHDHGDDHGDDHEDAHDHAEEAELDEHIWLSLKNAQVLANAISEALQQIDPANKEAYAANTGSFLQALSALDSRYQETVDAAAGDTLLFGDRFPFRYLTEDYGLHYYAAFAGCSAETEASFETISFLSRKVDELNLHCVLTIEGTQHKIAQTIVQNTAHQDQKILTMNSMQSVTAQDVENGIHYLDIMEQNLAVLKEALG